MRTIKRSAALAAAAALMSVAGVTPTQPIAAQAAPASVMAAKPKVSIKVSTGTAKKGQRIIISGVTSPRAKVKIQAATGKTWRTVASTTASKKGAYRASVTHVGGTASYRVVVTAAGRSAVSATRKVAAPKSPKQYKLSDYMEPDTMKGTHSSINSVGYDYTVGVYVDQSVAWDLQGCTLLTTKIGVDDTFTSGVAGTRYTGSIAVNGDNVLHKTMIQGEDAYPVQLSLKGVNRLTFSTASQDAVWGRFAFANATVTCTTPPAKAS